MARNRDELVFVPLGGVDLEEPDVVVNVPADDAGPDPVAVAKLHEDRVRRVRLVGVRLGVFRALHLDYPDRHAAPGRVHVSAAPFAPRSSRGSPGRWAR